MNKVVKNQRDKGNFKDSAKLKSEFYIPSCIFNKKLSSFETIVKFLKQGCGLNFEEIAKLLGKKKQSVWRAYKTSVSKFKKSFEVTDLHYTIPVEIFKDSKYSLLEALVVFLKQEYDLSFSEISALLMRDERTVWTVYQRARKKNVK